MKQADLKLGVPGIVLTVARGGYIGLYIELKYGRNKTTESQKDWLRDLCGQNHLTAVCYGWGQAKDLIESYLKLAPTTIVRSKREEI